MNSESLNIHLSMKLAFELLEEVRERNTLVFLLN
jgi:hypothetical protein